MKKLFLILLLLPFIATAQNLVPNGSFEAYTKCPGSYSRQAAEFNVPGWRSISTGSPDYFNTCSEGEAAVPYNWAGVSDPYEPPENAEVVIRSDREAVEQSAQTILAALRQRRLID